MTKDIIAELTQIYKKSVIPTVVFSIDFSVLCSSESFKRNADLCFRDYSSDKKFIKKMNNHSGPLFYCRFDDYFYLVHILYSGNEYSVVEFISNKTFCINGLDYSFAEILVDMITRNRVSATKIFFAIDEIYSLVSPKDNNSDEIIKKLNIVDNDVSSLIRNLIEPEQIVNFYLQDSRDSYVDFAVLLNSLKNSLLNIFENSDVEIRTMCELGAVSYVSFNSTKAVLAGIIADIFHFKLDIDVLTVRSSLIADDYICVDFVGESLYGRKNRLLKGKKYDKDCSEDMLRILYCERYDCEITSETTESSISYRYKLKICCAEDQPVYTHCYFDNNNRFNMIHSKLSDLMINERYKYKGDIK